MRNHPLLVAILIATNLPAALAEERKNLRLSWSELGPAVEGRKVSLVLAGGTKAEGKILGVEPDALRLDVKWSTDSKVVRKGKTSVPRSSVSVIRTARYSKHWRLILMPAVTAAAVGALVAAAHSAHSSPSPVKIAGIEAGVTAGAVLAGYYVGKRLDRRELTEITIVESGGTK